MVPAQVAALFPRPADFVSRTGRGPRSQTELLRELAAERAQGFSEEVELIASGLRWRVRYLCAKSSTTCLCRRRQAVLHQIRYPLPESITATRLGVRRLLHVGIRISYPPPVRFASRQGDTAADHRRNPCGVPPTKRWALNGTPAAYGSGLHQFKAVRAFSQLLRVLGGDEEDAAQGTHRDAIDQ